MKRSLIALVAAFVLLAPAYAQTQPAPVPLSQMIAKIEKLPDFAAVVSIQWDDGVYEIDYKTKDGMERELRLDAETGEPAK